MSKLKRFNKSNGKNNTIKLIVAFLLVAVMSAVISYAVYQKEDEVLFINAKVGNFETSSSDIELAMKLDGEDIEVPPSKGYYNVIVECDHADGNWNNDKWLAEIGNITSNRVKCNVNFETLETRPLSIVEVGDYISMTPTSTSYTPPSNLTGCLSDSNCTQNTINPSELNLWRVIRKNDDGTVEVVSEFVSDKQICFYGLTGYLNSIGNLNTIAAQYTNEKYVSKTRHMGYSNQILNCSAISSCPEDTGYSTDTNLVKSATGSLLGKYLGGWSGAWYFLASRWYNDNGYWVREIKEDGSLWGGHLFAPSEGRSSGSCPGVRPILTLKSDVQIKSGDGSSAATAYTFE